MTEQPSDIGAPIATLCRQLETPINKPARREFVDVLNFKNPKNKDSMMITIEISKPHKKDFDMACKVYIKGYREDA